MILVHSANLFEGSTYNIPKPYDFKVGRQSFEDPKRVEDLFRQASKLFYLVVSAQEPPPIMYIRMLFGWDP